MTWELDDKTLTLDEKSQLEKILHILQDQVNLHKIEPVLNALEDIQMVNLTNILMEDAAFRRWMG